MERRRILFIDAGGGASGDMILGALVDLGVPLARIRRAVETLPIEGWTLRSRKIERHGLAARKVDVRLRGAHPRRGWSALQRIVRGGELDPRVRRLALNIFRRLVEAEAQAHGRSAETVHLHEAGGIDAIVDVVGACVGLEHLEVDRVVVSPMTTGFGTVRCAHGVYPVPGPATLLLVRGCPVQSGDLEAERLTPTGAAILTTVADAWGQLPPMRPLDVGYGAGDRVFPEAPNLLRMVLGEVEGALPSPTDGGSPEIAVIECTLDDSTPQALAFASERLLESGALEVFSTAVTMKKGRAGHQLTALVRPDQLEPIVRAVLSETSTLGLRFRTEGRVELERSSHKVKTRYGSVRVKVGRLGGTVMQVWPEYDDCAMLARSRRVSLPEVQQAALQAFRTKKK
jgi:uncharacterized protein (TIGR00299 family) protein